MPTPDSVVGTIHPSRPTRTSVRRPASWSWLLLPVIVVGAIAFPAAASDRTSDTASSSWTTATEEDDPSSAEEGSGPVVIQTSSSRLIPLPGAALGDAGWVSGGIRLGVTPVSALLVLERRARIERPLPGDGAARWSIVLVNGTTGAEQVAHTALLTDAGDGRAEVVVRLPTDALNADDVFRIEARTEIGDGSGAAGAARITVLDAALEVGVTS